LRPSADNLRFALRETVELVELDDCDRFLNFAHLALWACAILLRPDADILLFGRVPLPEVLEDCPARPWITEIACSNFSTSDCA
jgi:hypothetical protein